MKIANGGYVMHQLMTNISEEELERNQHTVLLPERVRNLLIRAPEQGSILSYYQLPVSFTEVLHTHHKKNI